MKNRLPYLTRLLLALIFAIVVWYLLPDRIIKHAMDPKYDGPVFPDDTETDDLLDLVKKKLQDLQSSGKLIQMNTKPLCGGNEDKPKTVVCVDPDCQKALPSNLSPENIKNIRRPVNRVDMSTIKDVRKNFEGLPEKVKFIFATAASSNHFEESIKAMKSLREKVLPFISNYTIVVYDLGLNSGQRNRFKGENDILLKDFPFSKLPKRFGKLLCYTWKPLIVLAHLEDAEFLVWMDSSIRFKEDITPYFQKVANTGILVYEDVHQLPQHTSLEMFQYFGDQACQYSSYAEIQATFMVFHNEPFVRRLIVEPWSACALDPKCMCPSGSLNMLDCSPNIRKYGKCHRFDQSAIGLITIKVFRQNRNSVLIEQLYYGIERG